MRRLLAVMVAVTALAVQAGATTVRVKASGGEDYTAIQPAINETSEGDTILVHPGTYSGEHNRGLRFWGTNRTIMSTDGPEVTVIDCGNSERGFSFDFGESPASVVDGLKIMNGLLYLGSAIRCEGTSPTIRNCIFEDNYAMGEGGAVHCWMGSSPTITNCQFLFNESEALGGALYCADNSSPVVTSCLFESNEAGTWGGAVRCTGNSSPTITDCLFKTNLAENGGALFCSTGSSPQVTDCVFVSNVALSYGGAVYCHDSSSPTFTSCTFHQSEAGTGGSGFYCVDSTPTLTSSIIAFGSSGEAVACGTGGGASLACCDLFGNAGGDWTGCIAGQAGISNNISADPQFCNLATDWTLDADSPCAEENSPTCGQIGALGIGCDSPVSESSWGTIKASYR